MGENEYHPDYVSPPGDTLMETMIHLGLNSRNFSSIAGISEEIVLGILDGKVEIDGIIAKKLETGTGISSDFWLRREEHFRASL